MTPPAGIAARGAGLRFPGGVEALAGLDLHIPDGAFAAVVGRSGCGKSTMLRLAAGLAEPTAGRFEVGGLPAREARRRHRHIAFVFQQPTLLPWRRVLGNVLLPLQLQRRLDDESRAYAAGLLDLVGLADFRRAWPHQLSGGMQMRVSLARALATRPRLLLLDEPFAALDDITRQRLNEELLALWQRAGFTALFVTHNVSEAVFLASRVLVMTDRPGRVAEEVAVPFAYPRDPELRAAPEFAALCGRIGRLLRGGGTR